MNDYSLMHEKIENVLALIEDRGIRLLVFEAMLRHQDIFVKAPGACSRHHAYEGGLLDHSASTALLAHKMCEHYSGLKPNKDVVLAGAFLHDIGKIECYELKDVPDTKTRVEDNGILTETILRKVPTRTARDTLHHHIPIGYYLIRRIIDTIKIDRELADHILHIIISHHGRVEWRSNVTPQTPEAFIVSQADVMDAFLASSVEDRKGYNLSK